MQTNIYAQKDNGDLRLLAEVEGLDDPAMAVDALLDEMPRLKQREFVAIVLEHITFIEAGDEIVQPRRQISVRNGSGATTTAVAETPAPRRRGRPRKQQPEAAVEESDNGGVTVEEEAPAPKRRGRPPKAAAKKKASPFRSNPASAE